MTPTWALPLVLAAMAAPAGAGQSTFPVPRAEPEFRPLVSYVADYCRTIVRDVERFRVAALPFGPLDVVATRGTREEARALRNLYLGVAGKLCEVDSVALSRSFSCGPQCVASRRQELVDKVPATRRLVQAFREQRGLNLISQWGLVGEYRVNNLFTIMGQTREAAESGLMGFLPSKTWSGPKEISDSLRAAKLSPERIQDLVRDIKRLSLAALVREGDAVRAIRMGVSTKESGILFLGKGSKLPVVGGDVGRGARYVVVDRIDSQTVFYETE